MTRSIPFHKQTDVSKQAGQQTFDRMPFLKHSTAEPQQEQYLSQYIARKQEEAPRITFDEWFKQQGFNSDLLYAARDYLHMTWNAALKQGKL